MTNRSSVVSVDGVNAYGAFPAAAAYVVSYWAPDAVKRQALALRKLIGQRVQLCFGTTDEQNVMAIFDVLGDPGGQIRFVGPKFVFSSPVIVNRSHVSFVGDGFGYWKAFIGGDPGSSDEGPGKTIIEASDAFQITATHPYDPYRTKGIEFRDLYLYGKDYSGIGITSDDDTDQLVIERIMCHKFATGMKIRSDSPHIKMNTVMDCGAGGADDCGIWLSDGWQGTVEDNTIYDLNGRGLHIWADGAIIANNTIGRCTDGLLLQTAHRACVHANHFWQNRGDSISSFGSDDVTVIGNTVGMDDGSTGTGIYIDSVRNVVKGNTVRSFSTTTPAAPQFGININIASTDGICEDNVISGPFAQFPFYNSSEYRSRRTHVDYLPNVQAADGASILSGFDLTTVSAGDHMTPLLGNTDCARNIEIAITDSDASITDFDIAIEGYDSTGRGHEEHFVFADGLTQSGKFAYAVVNAVRVDVLTGANAGDTIDVGVGSKLGMSNLMVESTDMLKVRKNGAHLDFTGWTLDLTNGTIDVSPAGAIATGDNFVFRFAVNQNRIVT